MYSVPLSVRTAECSKLPRATKKNPAPAPHHGEPLRRGVLDGGMETPDSAPTVSNHEPMMAQKFLFLLETDAGRWWGEPVGDRNFMARFGGVVHRGRSVRAGKKQGHFDLDVIYRETGAASGRGGPPISVCVSQ